MLDTIKHVLYAWEGYDAAYLALAETLEAPLPTCDHALAAVLGTRAVVEVA